MLSPLEVENRRSAHAVISVGRRSCAIARAIVACDFFVAVTATFRLLYVFVVIEHGSRRFLRVADTAHSSAAWTLQQLREAVQESRLDRA